MMEAPVADILTELDRWWPVLGILATLVYGWGVYHLSRRFATRAEHHDTQKTVAELGDRVDGNGSRRQDHARHTAFP